MSDEITIQELQQMEQTILSISTQIQTLNSRISEIESALENVETSNKSYKILGNIMVLDTKENISKNLISDKESAKSRLLSLKKQDEKMRDLFSKKQKLYLEKHKKTNNTSTK